MSFQSQIKAFNKMYGMPTGEKPGIPRDVFPTADAMMDRLVDFKHILAEELEEVDELINHINEGANEVEILTELADWLGDIQVYCASEMVKFGLDNATVLDIIMQSNMSKLGKDGKPIYDTRGKVMKGPNYCKPEPMIAHYISEATMTTYHAPFTLDDAMTEIRALRIALRRHNSVVAERDELRAKLAALEKQEPVAWMNNKRDMTYFGHYNKDDLPRYAAAGAAPVPEGWQLVPVEPTQEMCEVTTWDFNRFYAPHEIYKAMLAAAPKEPTCSAQNL